MHTLLLYVIHILYSLPQMSNGMGERKLPQHKHVPLSLSTHRSALYVTAGIGEIVQSTTPEQLNGDSQHKMTNMSAFKVYARSKIHTCRKYHVMPMGLFIQQWKSF